MRLTLLVFFISIVCVFVSCGNSNHQNSSATSTAETSSAANDQRPGEGIVGEWEQQFTCFDRNGNFKLDPEEKTPSGTKLGFDWFRFNADGSCLRDKDIQFKGSYSIQEKNGNKKLIIEGGDKIKYSITGLSANELVLGSDGAFIVFKRIQ